MSVANKAIIRRYMEELWNQGNLAVLDEIFATHFVDHIPAFLDSQSDFEETKQFVTGFRAAFPDVHITVEDIIAEGDKIVCRWTTRGTHKGDLMGIPPTGKQLTFTGMTILRIESGKIVERWVNWDALGVMQQLGVIPPRE